MKLIEQTARDLCADDTRYHPTIDEEFWHTYERTARLFFQVLDEAGYVPAPREPEEDLLERAACASGISRSDFYVSYRAMIAAAPKVEDL